MALLASPERVAPLVAARESLPSTPYASMAGGEGWPETHCRANFVLRSPARPQAKAAQEEREKEERRRLIAGHKEEEEEVKQHLVDSRAKQKKALQARHSNPPPPAPAPASRVSLCGRLAL